MLIIAGFLMLLSTTNQELKRNYEKGYNDRQAEIMQTLKNADNQCNMTTSGKRSTGGVMIDEDIKLMPQYTEDNRKQNYYSNIVYQCRTERGFSVDAIWIGNSRCECITFGLKK